MWEDTCNQARTPFDTSKAHAIAVNVDTEEGTATLTFDTPIDTVDQPEDWLINGSPGTSITEFVSGQSSFAFTIGGSILSSGTVSWGAAAITFTPPATLDPGSIPYP